VRTTLASGEDGIVDTLLKVRSIWIIFFEENQAGTGATKSFVCSGGNNVAIIKRIIQLLGSNETRGVSDVSHEPCTLLVGNLTKLSIIPVAWISRSTTDDKTRLEYFSLLSKAGVVDEVSVGSDSIRVRLEINRRCSHLLLGSLESEHCQYSHRNSPLTHVVSMGKMTTIGKTKAHEAILRLDEGGQRSEAKAR